jgi:filamentous hemagglutinin family protein
VPWALAELPTGATVRAGNVNITPLTGTQLLINQNSPKAIIDWQGFSISRGNTVQFVHANSTDITLNRVTGLGLSAIDGRMLANGQVWLINPNGVLIGAGGQINSTGFLATTRNLADADFLAGRYQFKDSAQPGSAIVNQGNIKASNGGYVVLAGEKINNEGLIQADLGSVVLGGAKTFVLDLNGDKLLSFAITTPVAQLPADGTAMVNNNGTLQADGGRVLMTASAAADVIGSVVNTSGLIQANSVSRINGEVVLEVAGMVQLQSSGSIQMSGSISANAVANGTGNGGQIMVIADTSNPNSSTTVSGSLSAQAGNLGGNGGFIETSGSKITIEPTTRVNTTAPNGLTGTWLIDPTDLTIQSGSGLQTTSSIGADTLANALATNNVTLTTSSTSATGTTTSSIATSPQDGDIHVNAPVSWASVNKLTLSAHGDININADISAVAGSLALHYGQGAIAVGNTSDYYINQGAKVNLPGGQNFSTKLGNNGVVTNFDVITSANLRDFFVYDHFTGALNGAYALGSDIDASNTTTSGFNPISPFSGIFDGFGHTINHLQINQPSSRTVGFFGVAEPSAVIRNVGIVDAGISAPSYDTALNVYNPYDYLSSAGSNFVGGLVGVNFGTITNSYVTGSVSSPLEWSRVGGLVGLNYGTVSDSHSTATVSGFSTGGLVGWNDGGWVNMSDATGDVTGTGFTGGLVGWNTGSSGLVSYSYAYGNVTNAGTYTSGDLVGMNEWGGTIINSYGMPSGSSTGSTTDTSSATTQTATAAMLLTNQQSALTSATTQLATSLLTTNNAAATTPTGTSTTVATVTTALPISEAAVVTDAPVAATSTALPPEVVADTSTAVATASPVATTVASSTPVGTAVQPIATSVSTTISTTIPTPASANASTLTTRTTADPVAANVTTQARTTLPVMASSTAGTTSVVVAAPPSPISAVKPPTPKDAADTGDKTLAAAMPAPARTTVAQAKRVQTTPRVVNLGFVSLQQTAPAKLPAATLVEQRFSLTGNRSTW